MLCPHRAVPLISLLVPLVEAAHQESLDLQGLLAGLPHSGLQLVSPTFDRFPLCLCLIPYYFVFL